MAAAKEGEESKAREVEVAAWELQVERTGRRMPFLERRGQLWKVDSKELDMTRLHAVVSSRERSDEASRTAMAHQRALCQVSGTVPNLPLSTRQKRFPNIPAREYK